MLKKALDRADALEQRNAELEQHNAELEALAVREVLEGFVAAYREDRKSHPWIMPFTRRPT